MKKYYRYIIVSSVAWILCAGLVSCSKSATDYLDELSKLFNEYKELSDEGDTEQAAKVKEKGEVLVAEIINKCKEDEEFRAIIKKRAPELVDELLDIHE